MKQIISLWIAVIILSGGLAWSLWQQCELRQQAKANRDAVLRCGELNPAVSRIMDDVSALRVKTATMQIDLDGINAEQIKRDIATVIIDLRLLKEDHENLDSRCAKLSKELSLLGTVLRR